MVDPSSPLVNACCKQLLPLQVPRNVFQKAISRKDKTEYMIFPVPVQIKDDQRSSVRGRGDAASLPFASSLVTAP